MKNKCEKCIAHGFFNGCTCYFAEDEKNCKYKNLTNKQKCKIINDFEQKIDSFYESYE